MIVVAPSVLLPLFVEFTKPFLELPTWIFFVALTEMILAIRLIHEGTALAPPLRRLVTVIDLAMPNMLALIFVLAPLSSLTALMHSQLFGLFDDGFSDVVVSLSRVVNMLTAPPAQENTEGRQKEAQPEGSELLFYWSTFVIRLCFGSFIVAILVGAFNKAVATEATTAEEMERDRSLPADYEQPPDSSGERAVCARLRRFTGYFFTSSLYATRPAARLLAILEAQVALAEVSDPTGHRVKGEQVMLPADELRAAVGDEPARLLLAQHGARRRDDDAAHSA
jgi:hypothetical protein